MGLSLSDKASLIRVNPTFARKAGTPVYFIGKVTKKTEKAIYIVGRGTLRMKAKGICFACGRELTHPVSIALGIGPECGKHFWKWALIGGHEKDTQIREHIKNIKITNGSRKV